MPSAPNLSSRLLDVSTIGHVALAAWAGRDAAAVEVHIHELELLGVPRPSRTPLFYRVAASLLTTSDSIQALGKHTSGEVEFVLVKLNGEVWVGVGSDHTDRAAERTSVALSKQLCAKVIAPELWRYDDIAPHWDQLALRAWVHRHGTRELYQEAHLSALLSPDQLIARYPDWMSMDTGIALFSGTIATRSAIGPAEFFEMELDDVVLRRALRHQYRIATLPVVA
jgi:hypothetical protein